MDETIKTENDDSYNFNVWMIVYSPNKKRVNNFNFINKSIHANYFPAIDSISHFKIYSDFAIHKNYCTASYRDKFKYRPGKLGCNLSHQLLLDTIYETSDTEWNLILEDDVHIDINVFMKDVQRVLQKANEKNCSYIQLYIHPKFIDIQTKQKEKVGENLYEMCFQWGTVAYFIKKQCIQEFTMQYPLSENIDVEYNNMIHKWNSLCWVNSGINTHGSVDNRDNNSRFGSLIYEKPEN
mgnify:FL=1